jgi:hypothetical protein
MFAGEGRGKGPADVDREMHRGLRAVALHLQIAVRSGNPRAVLGV